MWEYGTAYLPGPVSSFLPHNLPQPWVAICPRATIMLWKLGFPPSLNTASKTFSQMLFLFQGSFLSATSHMLTAQMLLQITGCYVASLGFSTPPKFLDIFLPVCLTTFCGCPNLTSNSISPFQNSTFSFSTWALPWVSKEPWICLHRLHHLEKHFHWPILHLTITPSFMR